VRFLLAIAFTFGLCTPLGGVGDHHDDLERIPESGLFEPRLQAGTAEFDLVDQALRGGEPLGGCPGPTRD